MIDIASQAPDYSRSLTTERLKAHFWLQVLQDPADAGLLELSVGRVHQLRMLVRSWRTSDAAEDLAAPSSVGS